MTSTQIVGNGLTRLEEDQQYAKLPSTKNKPYLQPKAEVAVRVPDVRIGVSKLGKTFTINARQAVMSAEIRGMRRTINTCGTTKPRSVSICLQVVEGTKALS